jgi:hypothetical protein
MNKEQKVDLIQDLIYRTSGKIIGEKDCRNLYDNVCQSDIITNAENRIKPLVDFLRSNPDTEYFISDEHSSICGRQVAAIIREKNPHIEMNEFLGLMMNIWYNIVLEFSISHGYQHN